MLQTVDQKVQIVIRRNKELIEINFKIGSIL